MIDFEPDADLDPDRALPTTDEEIRADWDEWIAAVLEQGQLR